MKPSATGALLLAVAVLSISSARSFAQPASSPVDEKAQEALVTSTWSGNILGLPVQAYLLDEGLLVLQSGEQKPRFERWNMRDGKLISRVKLSDQIVVVLRADVRGNTMIGTTDDMMGKTSPFELRKNLKPIPQLLAAAPPDRPYPPPPQVNPREFEGTFEIDLPERIGQKSPLMKAALNCTASMCKFTMGKDVNEVYDKLDSIRPSHFSQARFALTYARERKDKAREEAPYLAPLLDSDANIQSCVNLGYNKPQFPGADTPGMTILCKLDRSPWNKPVVLLMGSILANCGPAFCRYALTPMLRQ
jgi:hypothetical protein